MNLHDFINALRYEVGTVESPAGSNCNPYSHALNRPCERWCADFQVYMATTHGVIIPSTAAYTPTLAQAFRNINQWYDTPIQGDWAFYAFNGGRIDHVECVTSPTPTYHDFSAIGGNTSSDHAGDQTNGGGVFERHRVNAPVVGFGRPTYDIPAPSIEESETDMPKVMHWQGAIFLTGYDQVSGQPWRRTFPNPSRLEQVIGGGAAQTRPDGNAFDVTNNQFMQVYQDLGPA